MATNNAVNFTNPIGVSTGGTGVTTLTTYAPVCGGATSTGPVQQVSSGFATSGTVLKSAGAGVLPQFMPVGSLTKITTLTASASATLTFTSSDITSTYKWYMIEFTQIISSAGGTMRCSFSLNNGSSYIATGYQGTQIRTAYNSATIGRTTATTSCVMGLLDNSTDILSGTIFFYAASGEFSSFIGRVTEYASTGSTCTGGYIYGCNTANTGINNIQFSMNSGTFTTGSITLYGISS